MVAYVAQYNIEYLKETLPSFNFNIPLFHLHTVTVDTSNEDWYYGLYVYDTNRILVNFTDIDTEKFFRSNVSHELFHLFARGQVGLDKIYLAGSSVDTLGTSETPLEQNFINEWFVNRASYAAFGEEPDNLSYDIEQRMIELICFLLLTSKSQSEDTGVNFISSSMISHLKQTLGKSDESIRQLQESSVPIKLIPLLKGAV